jgi:hypothetical protein
MSGERQSKIGKWTQSDYHQSGICLNGFDDRVNSVKRVRRLSRVWIAVVSKTVATVEPGGALVGSQQRLTSADVDRNFSLAEFNGVKGVSSGLPDVDISRDGSDTSDSDIRRA